MKFVKGILYLCLVVFPIVTSGQTINPYTMIDEYGFRQAQEQRPLAEKAISLVNEIVDPALRLKLMASWSPIIDFDIPRIPVILLKPDVRIQQEIAFVAPKVRAIFLNESKMLDFMKQHCDESDSGRMQVDYHEFLTVILLHELGHLYHQDAESNFDMRTGTYNRNITQSKNRELRADRFAGDQILSASDTLNTHWTLNASFVSFAVTKMSWNLSHTRIIKNFGAPDNVSFWDDSDTHPNMELRMLLIQNAAMKSDEGESLIQDFMKRRNEANTDVLYIKDQ